jgi:putative flippase GtrA
MKDSITTFIDFFHPPFRKFIDTKTFRYLACGSANTGLDILLSIVCFKFILKEQVLEIPILGLAMKAHVAAFLMSFTVTFPLGFMLMRHVVFTDSILRGRVQLARYFTLVMINILLNYIFLKLFFEYFHLKFTLAKIITTVIIVIFSYLIQRHFTFKSSPVSKD